jgi:O-antigen ligase
MGSYLSRLTPLLVGLFLITKSFNQIKDFFFYTIFIFVGFVIFLSGERTSFFYYLLLILYINIFLNKKKIKIFSILSLAIIFLLILYKPNTKSRIYTETINQIHNDNKISKSINFYSVVHEGHYNSAIKIFFDNKIFGIGPKMYRIICREDKYYVNFYSCSTHPHHTYIQLLAETGIVGFSCVFFILTYLFYIITKALIQKYFYNRFIFKEFQHCMIISFLITLSPFTPSGNFFNNWLNIIYFLPLGFYFYTNNKI